MNSHQTKFHRNESSPKKYASRVQSFVFIAYISDMRCITSEDRINCHNHKSWCRIILYTRVWYVSQYRISCIRGKMLKYRTWHLSEGNSDWFWIIRCNLYSYNTETEKENSVRWKRSCYQKYQCSAQVRTVDGEITIDVSQHKLQMLRLNWSRRKYDAS